MAVNPFAVDFFNLESKKVGDILIGGPVDRYTQVIAVFGLEFGLQIGIGEPVITKPVEVGKLLVRNLVEFSIRTGSERLTDKIVHVKHRVGNCFAFPGHPVGQRDCLLIAEVGSDQVGIIDIGIINVFS